MRWKVDTAACTVFCGGFEEEMTTASLHGKLCYGQAKPSAALPNSTGISTGEEPFQNPLVLTWHNAGSRVLHTDALHLPPVLHEVRVADL